jgi:hypothetical protein
MGLLDDVFKAKVTYKDEGTPLDGATPPSTTTPPAPMRQRFFASNPALGSGAGGPGKRGVSSTISVPIPPGAKSYRVSLGPTQLDRDGLPAMLRPRDNTDAILGAFSARPLGLLEDATADLVSGVSTTIELGSSLVASVALPPPRAIRVTVVWGLDGAESIPAGVLQVPVYVDFED